jgi:hypothetical protein
MLCRGSKFSQIGLQRGFSCHGWLGQFLWLHTLMTLSFPTAPLPVMMGWDAPPQYIMNCWRPWNWDIDCVLLPASSFPLVTCALRVNNYLDLPIRLPVVFIVTPMIEWVDSMPALFLYPIQLRKSLTDLIFHSFHMAASSLLLTAQFYIPTFSIYFIYTSGHPIYVGADLSNRLGYCFSISFELQPNKWKSQGGFR